MKLSSALILTALLGTSAAFAATTPAAADTAHPAHGHSLKACNKQADEKKLTGDARTSFVKDCRAAKTESK